MRFQWAPLRRGRGRLANRTTNKPTLRLRWQPVVAGALIWMALVLLNGSLRSLLPQLGERMLIAGAQLAVLIPLLHYGGFLRSTGLALRSPIAHSAREVGIILLVLISLVSLLGVRLASTIANGSALNAEHGFLSFAPLLAGGMLMSMLIHPLIALLTFTVLLAGSALAQGLPVQTLGAVGLSGWIGIYSVAPLRRRSQLFLTGVLVSAVLALTSITVQIGSGVALLDALQSGFWGVVGGVFAIALFWLGLTLLERPFRLATPMVLMELASLEHPLLRELREKAPGTYFHSQMVGQLAEEAALAIGADSLLARVAGYYHDIGKLTKPDFYIENQTGINSHERINPALSARIIASHVRDGVDLARQHRLPTALCDIIAQHHGTSLITYFYHQAVGSMPDPVLEQHFRYEGPKPQTREAAIIMLADTVEASTRVLGEMTPHRLANFIHDMVEMRRQDGQLDECGLTFCDLKRIEEAFLRVLVASRHKRIEYPNTEEVYAVRPS